MIVDFIREHADHREAGGLRWGVEPICAVLTEHGLQVAPSTYYEHAGAGPDERGSVRDAHLLSEIRRVHAANYAVYGARKVWLQLNREGVPVARCTVERLMREAGLHGAVRGKVKRTTIPDPAAERARDLVGRNFAPSAPDRLWVADITYVSARGQGGCTSRSSSTPTPAASSAGAPAPTMSTELVLDALEQAMWTRQRAGPSLDPLWHIPIVGRSTSHSVHRTPRRGRHRRLGRHRRRLATTTPWPRRSTGCTRPS